MAYGSRKGGKKDPGMKHPRGKMGHEAGRGRAAAVASKKHDETDLKRTRKTRRGDT